MTHAVRARKEARREDRRHRRLCQCNRAAGGYGDCLETRYRRRFCLCGDACPVPRRTGGSRIICNAIPTIRRGWKHISKPARRNGRRRSPACQLGRSRAFAHLVGRTKRTYFRLGYGFTRQRNGAVNMHAAASIACVTGAFQYEGGGAFHSNSGIFRMDKREIEGRAFQKKRHPLSRPVENRPDPDR